MTKYKLRVYSLFERRYKKLVKKDKKLATKTADSLKKLSQDPYQASLRTHKVDSRILKNCYSSRVSGDIRIIWSFSKESIQIINIYDIGGHEGSHKVYN